jgi:hypothetical protein
MREPDAALDGSTPSDDRPAVARPASHVGVGETEQRLVAGRVGTHSSLGQDAADQAGRCSGQGAAVGVDAGAIQFPGTRI